MELSNLIFLLYFRKLFSELKKKKKKKKKLRKNSYISEGTDKAPKTNKKSAPEKFLVSFDVFVIFTAVKHREIPCEMGIQNKRIRAHHQSSPKVQIFYEVFLRAQ